MKIAYTTETDSIHTENLKEETGSYRYYDLSQIRSISRGNETFVVTLVKLFIDQTPLFVNEIVENYHAGNYISMGESAHKLKQSIFTMGITDLKEAVVDIVSAGRNNTWNESLPIQIELLKCIIAVVIRELRNEFGL